VAVAELKMAALTKSGAVVAAFVALLAVPSTTCSESMARPG